MFLEMNYTRRLLTLIKIGKTILMGCLDIGLMVTIISASTKNFICISSFEDGDKGSILMLLLGSNSGSGTIKNYLPI